MSDPTECVPKIGELHEIPANLKAEMVERSNRAKALVEKATKGVGRPFYRVSIGTRAEHIIIAGSTIRSIYVRDANIHKMASPGLKHLEDLLNLLSILPRGFGADEARIKETRGLDCVSVPRAVYDRIMLALDSIERG